MTDGLKRKPQGDWKIIGDEWNLEYNIAKILRCNRSSTQKKKYSYRQLH